MAKAAQTDRRKGHIFGDKQGCLDPAAAGGHFVAKVVLVELGGNGEKFSR